MKVVCNRAELERGLSITAGAVATRTPKPVLQCVRISAEKGLLSLMATDLEVAIRYTLGAVDVTKPGEALVPAGELRETISKLPDETVTLTDESGKLVVRSANSVHTMYQMELADFPPVGDFSEEAGTTVKTAELKDLVRKVVYAAAKENTRYAIHGIRWEISGKQIRLIATDGRRLAKSWGVCEGDAKDLGAILPIRAMRLLDNVLQMPEEPVTVRISDNQAQFQTKVAVLTTQLVEGTFPRYDDVIPKDNDKKIEFTTSEIVKCIELAAVMTSEESRGVKFVLKNNLMVISSQVPERGEAEVKLSAKYTGPELTVGFNPDFLLEALKAADTETVTIELKDSNKPGLLRAGSNFLYVIMPVSLN